MSLKRIIREQLEMLVERGSRKSISSQKMASFAEKCNFYNVSENGSGDQQYLTLYYRAPKDGDYDVSVRRDFSKLENMANIGGWVINSSGNHYDGLRDYYKRFNNPDMHVGTIFVNMEPEYSQNMDDYFGTKENEIDNNDDDDDYDLKKHLGVGYQRGIFYHVTQRKYLKSILAHGLRPQNGGGITRWRNTTPRLYLSLLPDFSDIEYQYDDDEYEDDRVVLKVDLRNVMDSFDFYVDNRYSNAVYTYAEIPPNFITVMDNSTLRDFHSRYYMTYLIGYYFEKIIDANWGNYNDAGKKREVSYYSHLVAKKLRDMVTKASEGYGVNKDALRNLDYEIKQYISNYCNN